MNSRQIKLTVSYLSILLISCVSGTHYLFSVYSISIQERLNFSSVQINTIGSACNYGVFLGKPVLGYFVDNYGARRVCFAASILIFAGFSCLALTYEKIFPTSFLLCAFYLFWTGVASSGGAVSFLTTTAKNFSSNRGTAISIPLALLGLSAFIYSQINMHFFDDTFHFLLFIAFTAGLCMSFGSLFLVVIPAPQHVSDTIESGSNDSISRDDQRIEQTPLLNKNNSNTINRDQIELDIGGWQLLRNKDAISMILILVFFAGTGLMYINNVGIIIESLYHASATPHSDAKIKNLLGFHVSLISICSCIGRILIGPLSDIAKNYFDLSRICSLLFAGVWLFCGNLLALLWVHDIDQLWIVSTCIGLGFGVLYGVAPTTCSEYFGSRHFGFNWGLISCFPALGAQGFNLLFGYNNDLHREHCTGSECYNLAFYFSTISCLISIYIAYDWFSRVQKQREHNES